jgi:hypothetical protein
MGVVMDAEILHPSRRPPRVLPGDETRVQAEGFSLLDYVKDEEGRVGLVLADPPHLPPGRLYVMFDHWEWTGQIDVDKVRLLTDAELLELAKTYPSESGHGWCLNMMQPWFPRITCCKCGKFVGRDGVIEVEHFEMSSEIASVDGTCARCLP